MNAHHSTNPAYVPWRRQLLEASREHEGWLDEEDIHEVLAEANRKGVSAATILRCREVKAGQPAPPREPAGRKEPVRVLVVDVDMGTVERLARVLAQTGSYAVESATEVRAALQKAAVFKPELLVVEMALPGSVNGQGLVYYIARLLQRTVPAIILESVLQDADCSIVATRGTLHLRKPVKLRSLLHCMGQLVPVA